MVSDNVIFRIMANNTKIKFKIPANLPEDMVTNILKKEFNKIKFRHHLLKNDTYLKYCLFSLTPYCFNQKASRDYKTIITSNDKSLRIDVHRFIAS